MRPIFKDERHERLFRRDGCLLINALDAATVKRIEEVYLANFPADFTGFQSSLHLPCPERRAAIHGFITRIFDEHLSRYFHDYRAVAGSFVSKQPGEGGTVQPHRDWSLVDESRHTSLNLWAPLCDTTRENGALGLFKGSHRLRPTINSTNMPSPVYVPDEYLKHITFFRMKAGEVLVFATQMIHASWPNTSGRPRAAASVGIIPSEARPIHYVGGRSGPSKILELEVDAAFYHKYHLSKLRHVSPSDDHVVNTGGYPAREVEYTPVMIDGRDFHRLYEPRVVRALRQIKSRLRARLTSG
ncbi:MAG TPA: phytanoyl-CoA dioxygenase family protein [Pyrinomonadaceae bacterium]